ncbi:thiosulfate oxidation carrier protein SoxY [Candidatus Halocynthiibacter alkanivorans]|uniref:thiosulfate oxidation carrier protein SoxY n=1 Tax=Candidatus Halocynthiibacter alkanivorans TaxID=2267619 RepID=UPI000DF37D00|nr:thiosulfate oxidation carrier protein SoxY [Candidatus Halocynthiibacter alkanivorans]
MKFTRRDALTLGLGATAASLLPFSAASACEDAIAVFTGGQEPGEGDISLRLPASVKDGSSVPVLAEAPGAVVLALFTTHNPAPQIATVHFGPLSEPQSLLTRIRLSRSQDIVAVARLADGSYIRDRKSVKVTVNGFNI